MPEGRFVSKSISTSRQLKQVSLQADFLFGRCIPHLDRDGRLDGDPEIIKAIVCPLRPEMTSELIAAYLWELDDKGLVVWYEVQGQPVLFFPGFKTHQKGMRPERETASRFPAPDAVGAARICRPDSREAPAELPHDVNMADEELPPSEVKSSEVNGSEVKPNSIVEQNPSTAIIPITQKTSTVQPRTAEIVIAQIAELLADVAQSTTRRLSADEIRKAQASLVFAYWAKKMGHTKTIMDLARENLLIKRLKENRGDVNELLYCVDGALKDDWTMGRTERSTKRYDGIETIFRSRAQVEKFAGNIPAYKADTPHPMAVKYMGLSTDSENKGAA